MSGPATGDGNGSIPATLGKTALLVGLTVALMVVVRLWPPLAHAVNRVASTQTWQSLYGVFGADSGQSREQMILVGIVVVCFVTALVLVQGGSWCVRRLMTRP
ncbi:hypothetical protein AA103196_2788 [Ameyamaea chiangmaiensis NBRC 103196]|uniref:hypothetical protein n=1 Tax=Ameyamaea chiangmaiensis TaxID=442969 RepID=UPI002156E3CC|nr:hypothetical protein [Ameyamaea chiangmaiensis]GBQ71482.1 hypothetical protein AA103196_2788 [Ameyamaea chiangmaiensis NBRC 103196]